jgi:predicted transglutaminase-like cysteine proteinase
MSSGTQHRTRRYAAVTLALLALGVTGDNAVAGPIPSAAAAPFLYPASAPYLAVGETTRPPIGWVEFCIEQVHECAVKPAAARDVVLNAKAWASLIRINDWVNQAIKPITDLDHWGTVEKWSYPDDGYGDCEDYVLLKRRMLIEAGWPRSALLITVVRDRKGDGHAVLTARTDKGEFILDNQNDKILPWTETGYRYVKRQSQSDPNTWVSLGDPRPATATASAR